MDSAAEDEAIAQANDPDSQYTLLGNAFDTQDDIEMLTCTVRHDVVIDQETDTIEDNVSDVVWPAKEQVEIRIFKDDQAVRFQKRNYGRCNGCSFGDQSDTCDWTDIASMDLSEGYISPTSYYFHAVVTDDVGKCCSHAYGTGSGYPCDVTLNGPASATLMSCHEHFGHGCRYPRVSYQYLAEVITDTPGLITTDNCHPEDDCRLKDEKVCDYSGGNCVWTWRDFVPTNLAALSYCKNISVPGSGIYTACMDGKDATLIKSGYPPKLLGSDNNNSMWWRIERTYKCDAGKKKFDFSRAKERVKSVTETLHDDETSLSYRDYRENNNGDWVYSDDAATLPDRDTYEVCEKACKLRKIKDDTQAGIMGTTAEYRNTTQGYDYIYKACSADGVCPVENGETVVKPCRCISDFTEATVVMSGLNAASHDVICSDGVMK